MQQRTQLNYRMHMVYQDRTNMGGNNDVFTTTCWTRLSACKDRDEASRRLILDQLIGRYWRPVYWYCRRKGYQNENAKDLTQSFFQDIVLGRDLFAQAESAKGRFRTFLLTALDRYLIDVHRRENASKRAPQKHVISLDVEDLPDLPEDQRQTSPEQVFCYTWATDLLDEVLGLVEDECRQNDQLLHWNVFQARILQPLWDNGPEPALTELCQLFDISSGSQISNMLVTVKRKFKRLLEQQIRLQMDHDADFQSELGDLLDILSRPGARG